MFGLQNEMTQCWLLLLYYYDVLCFNYYVEEQVS